MKKEKVDIISLKSLKLGFYCLPKPLFSVLMRFFTTGEIVASMEVRSRLPAAMYSRILPSWIYEQRIVSSKSNTRFA